MFDSSMYNLSNPAFTEDIGIANGFSPLNIGYPGYGCYFAGTPMAKDSMILKGPLSHDTLDIPQRQKDKNNWKMALKALGIAALGIIGFKIGKNLFIKCKNGLLKLFNKTPKTN